MFRSACFLQPEVLFVDDWNQEADLIGVFGAGQNEHDVIIQRCPYKKSALRSPENAPMRTFSGKFPVFSPFYSIIFFKQIIELYALWSF